MGPGYGYIFLISDGAYRLIILLSDGERERESVCVCVTEIG